MAIILTRVPVVIHSGGYESRVVGYLNPVIFQFLQFTNQFTKVEQLAGDANVRITSASSTGITGGGIFLPDIGIGSSIRFASYGDGVYSGVDVGTVTAYTTVAPFTIDLAGVIFRGNSNGYWENLTQRKNIRLETRLLEQNTSGGIVPISKAYSSWYTQPNLIGLVDLSSELKSLFYEREKYPYDASNYLYKSARPFYFQYREHHQGYIAGPSDWVTYILGGGDPMLACPSRKQIRELYGGNLLDWTLKAPSSGGLGGDPGVGNNFVNFDFLGNMIPWLKTAENFDDGFLSTIHWSPPSDVVTHNLKNCVYQSVNVVAGSHRLRFTVRTGAFFPGTFEIWAFNNPATYLTADSNLISSVTYPINTNTTVDASFTFPANRTYVGFRWNSAAGTLDQIVTYFSFQDLVDTGTITNAPPGRILERANEPSIYGFNINAISALRNGDFIASASPWKTTAAIAGRNWSWVAGVMYLPTAAAPSPFLYQEVNAKPGGIYTMVIRASQFPLLAGDLLFEIWAFDDPLNPTTTGTLLEGISTFGSTTPVDKTKFITIPEGAKYLGFRTNNGVASDVSLDKVSMFQQIIQRPIAYMTDNFMPATFAMHFETQDINHAVITSAAITCPGSPMGIHVFSIQECPIGATFIKVWATDVADPAIRFSVDTLYKMKELCDPYILLEYQNSIGGLSQHAFMIKHNVSIQPATDKPVTSIYEFDIEHSEGNLFKDGTDWKTELIMYDDYVPTADIVWVAEIKTSKQVRILFPNGANIFCVVTATDTAWVTNTKFTRLQITVRIPDNFNPILLEPELV